MTRDVWYKLDDFLAPKPTEIVAHLLVKLGLVVVDVDQLDVDGGVAEALVLTLNTCSGSDLRIAIVKKGSAKAFDPEP